MVAPLSLDTQVKALTAAATANLNAAATQGKPSTSDKARAQAVDFEASFLSSMFQNMFTDIKGDGPMGSGPAVGVWRSFLTNEYGKSVAKAGGIGIADHVYKSLMAHQEAHAK
jgi:flagellar protein FlgJ